MFLALVSMVFRFTRGLGGSTRLSDTYPWGLWILFDLVWIAVAAGAFAVAGLIYVFRRKDLYALGRSSVLIGLLSYSFVTVTLIADLGLPWNSYQLALQAPEHSAMFEVSWCVGLYVTILLLEFLPIPLERFGLARAMNAWRKYSGYYVAFAVTLFVFMLSRSVVYAALAAVVFLALAWIFREEGLRGEPVMLAIAAVTLSTMHQSSLGSLYLLMPRQLGPQWSTPLLPVNFFLSSIAAGTAVVILIFFAIGKFWRRRTPMSALAALGQITFWSLLVYWAVRLGDMVLRGRLAGAISGKRGLLFAAEIVLGGIVPLLLLARSSTRSQPRLLYWGALLTALGIILNRMNVVLFAMNLTGPMPNTDPRSYFPSIVEWSISIGLIAATIFLFGFAARHMPLLPKEEPAGGH
jgi:formate dehydrogenase iron-sulfur subunit